MDTKYANGFAKQIKTPQAICYEISYVNCD